MNRGVLTHPRLTESLERAPVVPRGEYDYLVHPLTDGVPRSDPRLLDEVAEGLHRLLEPFLQDDGVDVLLTAEAMGLPLVTMLSERTGIGYLVARKRSYGLPGEVSLDQVTGYSRTRLHLNDIHSGDRVVVIDDLVSTGGTLRALLTGLRSCGAVPVAIGACVTKQEDLTPLARELECPMAALAAVRVVPDSGGKRVEVTATDIVADPRSMV